MTKKEKILAADLLDMAAEVFGRHGCNDVPEELFEGWSNDEMKKLERDDLESDGLEDYSADDPPCLADFGLMYYFAKALRAEAEAV
jgi:hypothetical protein